MALRPKGSDTNDSNTYTNFGFNPPEYSPKFCLEIIELGKKGANLVKICNNLGIHRTHYKTWCDRFPEFKIASNLASQYAQEFWESFGEKFLIETPQGDRINTNLYKFLMSARFEEYREIRTANVVAPVVLEERKVDDSLRQVFEELQDNIRNGQEPAFASNQQNSADSDRAKSASENSNRMDVRLAQKGTSLPDTP